MHQRSSQWPDPISPGLNAEALWQTRRARPPDADRVVAKRKQRSWVCSAARCLSLSCPLASIFRRAPGNDEVCRGPLSHQRASPPEVWQLPNRGHLRCTTAAIPARSNVDSHVLRFIGRSELTLVCQLYRRDGSSVKKEVPTGVALLE